LTFKAGDLNHSAWSGCLMKKKGIQDG